MSTAPASSETFASDPSEASGTPSNSGSKRSFFGLLKKKKAGKGTDDDQQTGETSPKAISDKPPQIPELTKVQPMSTSIPSPSPSPPGARSPRSPGRTLSSTSPDFARPSTSTAPYPSPSPPRLSTSSSQIFERNVQEHPNSAPLPASPAIPSHIQTEDRIPPVLSASSIAITDQDCDVDDVQIVMHTAHQPAVSVVAPGASSHHPHSSLDHSEDASNYSGDDLSSYGAGIGAAAAADKRRLSFISFADVVQAEQSQQFGDTLHTNTTPSSRGSPVQGAVDPVSISTITETLRGRSPSPIRLGSSPPQSNPKTGERSPGSPVRTADALSVERGELTIETMGQALRKTASGDLGQRSPIGNTFGRSGP